MSSGAGTAASPARPALVAGVVLTWVPLVLLLDRGVTLHVQWLLGAGTWLVLALVLRGESALAKVQVGVVVVFATVVEYTFSPLLGVYVYRLHNVPAFVPPGHGLVYLAAMCIGRAAFVRRHLLALVALTATVGTGYVAWGLSVPGRPDVLGALWFCCLLGFLGLGSSRGLYVGAFLVVTYLEVLGTTLQTWTWSSHDPTGIVSIGNPPTGAAGGYGWFDLAAILTAPAILRWNGRGRPLPFRPSRRSTSSWSKPLVLTAEPFAGPALPSSEVNAPPASVTTRLGAARSHSDTSGSTARSTPPSATSMCDQKSPKPRVRQQLRVSSKNASIFPSCSQPDRLE